MCGGVTGGDVTDRSYQNKYRMTQRGQLSQETSNAIFHPTEVNFLYRVPWVKSSRLPDFGVLLRVELLLGPENSLSQAENTTERLATTLLVWCAARAFAFASLADFPAVASTLSTNLPS